MAFAEQIGKIDLLRNEAETTLRLLESAIGRHRNLKQRMATAVQKANAEFAKLLLVEMQNSIKSGRPEWEPLSGLTVKVKGHSRPLFESGNLLNSLRVVRRPPKNLATRVTQLTEVGSFDTSSRYRDGSTASNVAKRMEEGFEFELTDDGAAYLATKGFHIPAGTVITVPPRPFLKPAEEKLQSQYRRFTKRILKHEFGPLLRAF